jgi:hypothetical protein
LGVLLSANRTKRGKVSPYLPAIAFIPIAFVFYPLFYADFVVIQSGIAFNCGEFAIIKMGLQALSQTP